MHPVETGQLQDGAHVEQNNWEIVRTVVGYAAAELLLLNKIWVLQSKLANFFCPQQKPVSKVRTGAKASKPKADSVGCFPG